MIMPRNRDVPFCALYDTCSGCACIAKMDGMAAVKAYITRMIEQTSGVKVLLLDSETVREGGRDTLSRAVHSAARAEFA